MKKILLLFSSFFAAILMISCDKQHEIEIEETTPIVVDGHEVIDLGLPSGTLWATCNIGANAPEEYGDYFAWGETQAKDRYAEDNYAFYDFDAKYLLTKYATDSIDWLGGLIDNLTLLESEDDAATMQWGNNYRMPTREECQELLDYCTWEWTTVHAIDGYRVIGKQAEIFLPAGGMRQNTFFNHVGTSGTYWSATLCKAFNIDAYCLSFDAFNHPMRPEVTHEGKNRHLGCLVRPVHSPK